MPIYSHSKLETFEQCPQKYKFKYIDKIKIKEKPIEAFLGSVVHITLDWLYQQVKQKKLPSIDETIIYYIKHRPFEDNTLETEKKIEISLDKTNEYKLVGIIDRLVYNKENDEIEIHDYKTANTLPTKDKMDNDRQLALYSIAIKEEFGSNNKIKLIWHYLAFNKKLVSERTDEQLEKLKKETIELIKRIESETEFPTNKSILCNWCPFKKICPAWN